MVDEKESLQKINLIKSPNLVSNWMTTQLVTIQVGQTLQDSVALMEHYNYYGLPVVNQAGKLEGLLTKSVLMQALADKLALTTQIQSIMETEVTIVSPSAPLESAMQMTEGCLPVIESNHRLVGIITRTDILRANSVQMHEFSNNMDYFRTLQEILNNAYEGIVVVNQSGHIMEINDAYCRFLGGKRTAFLKKPVEEVIENTRLKVILKTGIEERGRIQRINGQDMVVHRIPIKRNGQIEGAIGMLIFEDISEMYTILNRLNRPKKNNDNNNDEELTTKERFYFAKIIGESSALDHAKHLAKKAAKLPSTVLITGQSGTGKELFAQVIHELSSFSQGNFVSVNCSAIPENLLESELFGYEAGAFTGASRTGKKGKFELAENGTLFLDEIGDMPLLMQTKILRALQERVIEPVGSEYPKKINVRIIAATNQNLESLVAQGKFREDLFYRLNVIRLELPPLADHPEDILLLMQHFIKKFCLSFGMSSKYLSPKCQEVVQRYSWPGNIRELINVSEMLVGLSEQEQMSVRDLPLKMQNEAIEVPKTTPLKNLQAKNEKERILEVLAMTNYNKKRCADLLGIHRSTLYQKITRYGIEN